MAKRNWYETVNDRLPAERKNHGLDFWGNAWADAGRRAINRFFDSYPDFGLEPIDGLMDGLEGVGFQDFDDHYEMVTELGGNGDVKEDAVKIELLHEDAGSYVKVTYEHNTKTEHSRYSHSQTTCVTLPKDADEETVSAHFDEKNRVVVTVDKKVQKKQNHSRNIPIEGV